MNLSRTLLVASGLVVSSMTSAQTIWSSNSLTYLKNTSDFEVLTNDDINVFTLEHASGHNWGDAFMFVDRIDAKADENAPTHKETYGEVSARLSLSYAFDSKVAYGPLKDVFIAGTYEHASISEPNFSTGFDNYLIGVGTSWEIPGFAFFGADVYQANNELTDNDTQLTITYGYPITMGEHKVMIDGYIDWSSSADDHAADFHFNPQVRLDVGNYFGKPNAVEVGIEYSYWHNKFGIAGIDDESVVSAIVKVFL